MNVLDENIVAQQCEKLRQWRVPFRQIGSHLAGHGALDENLIPVLHGLPQPTFFTHDNDFFKSSLCHPAYAIVYLNIGDKQMAEFIRRFLRHPSFDTNAKRMGMVARAQASGIQYWKRGKAPLQLSKWPE